MGNVKDQLTPVLVPRVRPADLLKLTRHGCAPLAAQLTLIRASCTYIGPPHLPSLQPMSRSCVASAWWPDPLAQSSLMAKECIGLLGNGRLPETVSPRLIDLSGRIADPSVKSVLHLRLRVVVIPKDRAASHGLASDTFRTSRSYILFFLAVCMLSCPGGLLTLVPKFKGPAE